MMTWLTFGVTWVVCTVAFVTWWALLPRAPKPRKPTPNLTHAHPQCMGLWLHAWWEDELECVGCRARAVASDANLAEAQWMVRTETLLSLIEERANANEPWKGDRAA